MTWKAYAAVSGATVLAGWAVSAPPPSNVANSAGMAPSRPQGIAASEIEREAARLGASMRREKAYAQPLRDPFRFGASAQSGGAAADTAGVAVPTDVGESMPAPASQPAPQVSLAGIAEDQIDDPGGPRVERTAVLSTPGGVLLVREGDDVLGLYRVVTIESGAVELERADGTTFRIAFES